MIRDSIKEVLEMNKRNQDRLGIAIIVILATPMLCALVLTAAMVLAGCGSPTIHCTIGG